MTRLASLPALTLALASLAALGCSSAPDTSEATGSQSQDALSKKGKCRSNAQCGQLEFCDTEAAKSCGGQGVCTTRGINLFCMKAATVCGCDGNAYAGACNAHKAGVSVAQGGGFQDAPIDGDTLAEMPWQDASATYFYAFTGNGTVQNDSGTFTAYVEPPCLRSQPSCKIAVHEKKGTFSTYASTLELDYDDGSVAYFDAQTSCAKAYRLVGDDWGKTLTLTVSMITP